MQICIRERKAVSWS